MSCLVVGGGDRRGMVAGRGVPRFLCVTRGPCCSAQGGDSCVEGKSGPRGSTSPSPDPVQEAGGAQTEGCGQQARQPCSTAPPPLLLSLQLSDPTRHGASLSPGGPSNRPIAGSRAPPLQCLIPWVWAGAWDFASSTSSQAALGSEKPSLNKLLGSLPIKTDELGGGWYLRRPQPGILGGCFLPTL